MYTPQDLPPRPSSTDCSKMFASRHSHLSAPASMENGEWDWGVQLQQQRRQKSQQDRRRSDVGGKYVAEKEHTIRCPCPRKVVAPVLYMSEEWDVEQTASKIEVLSHPKDVAMAYAELFDIISAYRSTPTFSDSTSVYLDRAVEHWSGFGIIC